MRELHYVGPDEDPEILVVAAADTGEQFRLPVTEALRTATGPASPEPPAAEPVPSEPTVTNPPSPSVLEPASVSPRDIQVRVRAGEAPEVLAEEPGMTLDRVMRFAGPVLDERKRVAAEAQRARARKNGSDSHTVVFGALVDERLHAAGIEPTHVDWDSRRRHDGQWVVVGTWQEDGAPRSAHWLLNLTHRSISALDDAAADLLSDRPLRRLNPSEPERAAINEPADSARLAGIVTFPGSRTPVEPDDAIFDDVSDDAVFSNGASIDEVFDQEVFDDASADHEVFDGAPAHFDAGPTGTEAPVHHGETAPEDQPLAPIDNPAPTQPPAQATPDQAPAPRRVIRPAATHDEPHLPLDFTVTTPLPTELEAPTATVRNLGLARRADDDRGRHRQNRRTATTGAARPDDPLNATAVPSKAAEAGTSVPAADDGPATQQPIRAKRGEKPKMPSWDDILLGVRRKSD